MNRTAFKSPNLLMNRIVVISIMALFLGNYGVAQEQLSRKQQADVLFNRFEYYNAARLYLPLAEKKKPDVKLLEKLAECYRMMNDYEVAEKWYGKAVADAKAKPMSHYYYAEALQRNKKFDLAKEQYRVYGNRTGKSGEMNIKISSCDSAALWIGQPKDVKIRNIEALNTKFADWGLNYYGNDGFVFTSERSTDEKEKNSEIYKWTGNPWLKLYLANAENQPGQELSVVNQQNMPSKVDYHVGPLELNAAGDVAFVTIATRASASQLPLDKTDGKIKERLYTRRLELMTAVKKDGKWGDLKAFPYNNVKEYSLGHAALSKNGQVLYFASDMPGGLGKTDIWYTELQSDGSWAKPVNCGAELNTAEEEAFPTIGSEGELYYSSKGKIGMGGYDIYSSRGEKTQWGKSRNLKYPLNSTSDDFYLVSKDGKTGYFSSNREGGAGDDDIYGFSDQTPAAIILALDGTVYEQKTKTTLDSVLVTLTDGNGVAVNRKVTGQNGNFFFGLSRDQDYKIEISKFGYTSVFKTLSTKGMAKSDTLNMQAFLDKDKFEPGKTYVLRNIYYDFDKANIRVDAARELDKLLAILKENPAIWIELSSHTDSRGADQYNQWLSQRRANSAVQYLIDRGVERERIKAKGYGETMLLNKCANGVKCSHAAHQLNRRTEFKVIKK
ncbi:OmpA family protein [Pedobacter steynii]|nr:OmpA family protein [Pedobacter steynii]